MTVLQATRDGIRVSAHKNKNIKQHEDNGFDA